MISISPAQVLLGALLALLAGGAAYVFKLLTFSGAVAAFILGTVVYGLGGWTWAVVLISFFLSSSLLSVLFKKQKKRIEVDYAKGGTRDAAQVLANGGIAGLCVVMHVILPSSPLAWPIFCAALAGATADTWATECGVLNRRRPLLLFTWQRVEAGTSGAVSPTGILAAFSGAALIGVLCIGLAPFSGQSAQGVVLTIAAITLAGVVGSLIDSALGATLQAIYFCPHCQKKTERHPRHHCGTTTEFKRGLRWMTNDVVNCVCTLSAALLAWLIFSV